MGLIDELSSDQKYAISKIMDGVISLTENLCYAESRAESIAASVVVYMKENGWPSIDEVIEELKKYKEEQQ